ncbi:hypothetical protein [Paraburkholderia sp. C35]|uniref:hypothetical protein n=1 Tax=Paraburkholderia sp. C35 TaxID=2126993 RepID=UPI000D68AA39|nr:hypothetical protein [Paraburkholderia sp. C35]
MLSTGRYHDAEVVGLSYARADRVARIDFALVDGEAGLLFSGVLALRVSDFGLQNVVSRVLLSTDHHFSIDATRDHVRWACSQHDYQASLTDQKIAAIEEALSQRELLLFVIEPSAGAEIVILCETMLIASDKKTDAASEPAAPVGGIGQ